jgi:tight adherence protein C
MSRLLVWSGLALWAGSTLLLSRARWFSRMSLVARLAPYVPGGFARAARSGVFSLESFADTVGPTSRAVGERLSALLGVGEDLAVRLARIHSPLDLTAFRVRQVGWTVAALGVAAVFVVAIGPPAPVVFLCLLGGPLLAFLLSEQQIASASAQWQRRLFLELPVVTEQLAMLLSAGYSLTAALNRVSTRGQGACAADLGRVCSRVRQGLGEQEALREWAGIAQVEAVDRLVSVMALNREAADLGRLLSEEARSIRGDVQRELVERMERKSQQVWIPVTVATLLPGVIFMLIPFLEALRQFA